MKQKSIRSPFSLSGIGIHSGEKVSILISPAPENSGIIFYKNKKIIPARLSQLRSSLRGTALDGIAVTEHLLSAVYANEIDNLWIEVEGSELPILDGSALPFDSALREAGIVEQSAEKSILTLSTPIKITEGDASLEALPYHGFRVHFMVNFQGFGEQNFSFESGKDSYSREIAPARTFGYLEEYEELKKNGFALGAAEENALILSQSGYVNAPRFHDELVRHKILDLIGDLALLGRPLRAEIKAVKSGHKLNSDLVRRIAQHG